MKALRIPAALLLLAALVVGCSDQNAPTASTQTLLNPLFNFMNGPDNPGKSGVFRFESVVFVASTDPDRDLLAFHFQADDWIGCGGSSGFEESDVQWVTNPQEAHEAVKSLAQSGETPVFIYWLSDPEPDFCKFLAENWLYKGTHSVLVHDNDLFVSGPGANSFGWSAHGTVYDPSGTRCKYSENQNALISPDGEFLGWKNENIRVACQGPK